MCTTPTVEKMSVVKFALPQIVEVEVVPEEDKSSYWLDYADFERFRTEAKLTKFRWENHMNGFIKFDEANNTLRGIESFVEGKKTAPRMRSKHARSVLEEIQRQRKTGRAIDWEKVRQTSTRLSSEAVRRAVKLGKADEEARHKAWIQDEDEKGRPPLRTTSASESNRKKRSSSFLTLLRKRRAE
jgi:hypothetical protein